MENKITQTLPINDKTDNLTNKTRQLVKSISFYHKSLWILLILSILSFTFWTYFYYVTDKADINQMVHYISKERCNYKIDFISKKDTHKYTATGLSMLEIIGRWSKGKLVTLKFKLPKAECYYSKIVFSLIGFIPEKPPYQSAIVTFNGIKSGEIIIKSRQISKEYTLKVSPYLFKQGELNIIELNIKFPTSPKSLGQSSDTRLLGFSFQSVVFQ